MKKIITISLTFLIWGNVICQSKSVKRNLQEGKNLVKTNQYELSIEKYNLALKKSPKYVDLYIERGISYYLLKKYKKALSDFDNAIKLNPNNSRSYNCKGVIYMNVDSLLNYDLAISEFNKAIQINPKFLKALRNRAISKFEIGDYSGAKEDYTKVIELGTENENIYFYRGLSKEYLNDYNGAKEDYIKALEIKPDFQEATNGNELMYYKLNHEKIKKACEMEINWDTTRSRKIFKEYIPKNYSFLYSSDFLHFRRIIHELFLNNDLYVYQNIDTTDYFWCDRKSASGYMGTPPCNKPFKNYKNFLNSNTIENFTKNSFFIDIFNSNIEISNEDFMIYYKNKLGNTITLSLYKNFGEDFYNADGDLINEIREISWTFQFSYVDNNGEPVDTYFTFSKYIGLKENKSLYNDSNFYQGEKYEDLVNWKCILN